MSEPAPLRSVEPTRDVVLIHGYGSDPTNAWEATGWRSALEAAGYRVHAPALLGHGPRPGPETPEHYTPEGLAAALDVGELSKAHVIAHSMGGYIALALAAARPELVASLTLLAMDDAELLAPFAGFAGEDDEAIERVDPTAGRLVLGALRADPAHRATLLACAIGMADAPHPVVPVARAVIINGGADRFVTDGRTIARRIGAAYREVPDAGHLSILSDKEVLSMVIDHLAAAVSADLTAPDAFRRVAREHGDRVAVRLGAEEQTYAELYERACRLANGLASLGVAPGEAVATLAANRLESVEEVVGIALAGAVRVPLYTHNPPAVHRHMLETSGARVLIVDAAQLAAAEELSSIPGLTIVVHDADVPGTKSYATLLDAPAVDPDVPADDEAPFVIRFSSGTTGLPKAIMHREPSYRALGEALADLLHLDAHAVQIVAGPMSHVSGVLIWPMLARGGTQIIMQRFDPEAFVAQVRVGATHSILVPTMIQDILEVPGVDAAALASLRCIGYGGAPIDEQLLRRAIDVFPPVFVQLYGQSEVMPISSLPKSAHDPGDPGFSAGRLRTAGYPAPGVALRIVDDAGNDLPPGEIGEIAVRAEWVTDGLVGGSLEERLLPDGSLLTRDMGWVEEGLLVVADRKDDMIISGGYNIWPKEIEDALAAHPAIESAAVFGVPHARWGETPVAVVRAHPGVEVTEEALVEWCRDRVGSVKKPTAIVVQDEPLPRNGTGKVLRRELRRAYQERLAAEVVS